MFGVLFLAVIFTTVFFTACKKSSPQPGTIACFTYSPLNVISGQQVTYYNCSKNTIYHKWYFGDGDSDLIYDTVIHEYQLPGDYRVELIVKDGNGQSGSTTQTIQVHNPNYPGVYSGILNCSFSGQVLDTITITPNGADSLVIDNLYKTGTSFYSNVYGGNAQIPAQVYNAGSGNCLLQGRLVLSADSQSLTISVINTTVGRREECSAIFTRQ